MGVRVSGASSNGRRRGAPRVREAVDDDRTLSSSDQTAADSDHTPGIRDRSALERQETAKARIAAALARDAVANARDLTALARDEAATLRDRQLAAREPVQTDDARVVTGREVVMRAAENRRAAVLARAAAAESRTRAAADREQAARDRKQAARDRAEAQADREALLTQLALAETDALTGARTRAPGLRDLDREIDRARRTSSRLVVAYVDVVGLKAVNDTLGHAAGDVLLTGAVAAIRSHLRTYDLVVRLGGDEFVCAMSGATIHDARQRFDAVQAELPTDSTELRMGFAALDPDDDVTALVDRADAALPPAPIPR
jgi:diguanylate cyclase (GGDEF)-like protein